MATETDASTCKAPPTEPQAMNHVQDAKACGSACGGGMDVVVDWLKQLGIEQYRQVFEDEGFDSVNAVRAIREGDLTAMGVKTGHVRLIMTHLPEALAFDSGSFKATRPTSTKGRRCKPFSSWVPKKENGNIPFPPMVMSAAVGDQYPPHKKSCWGWDSMPQGPAKQPPRPIAASPSAPQLLQSVPRMPSTSWPSQPPLYNRLQAEHQASPAMVMISPPLTKRQRGRPRKEISATTGTEREGLAWKPLPVSMPSTPFGVPHRPPLMYDGQPMAAGQLMPKLMLLRAKSGAVTYMPPPMGNSNLLVNPYPATAPPLPIARLEIPPSRNKPERKRKRATAKTKQALSTPVDGSHESVCEALENPVVMKAEPFSKGIAPNDNNTAEKAATVICAPFEAVSNASLTPMAVPKSECNNVNGHKSCKAEIFPGESAGNSNDSESDTLSIVESPANDAAEKTGTEG